MTLKVETTQKQDVLSANIRILAFVLCIISYAFGGTVSTLMSVYLPVAVPELLNEKVSEARLGEVGALYQRNFTVWLDDWWNIVWRSKR